MNNGLKMHLDLGHTSTVFLRINAPGVMQNMNKESLFCTHFTKQKTCQILYFFVF